MPSIIEIFLRFLKVGATAYGGPAMAAQIKKTIVGECGWLTEPEFMQGVALCQLVPGATNVQLSTYIGYRLKGIRGALVSVTAFVLPAFGLLLGLSALYFRFGSLGFIRALFKGLGAIVVAIVLNAFLNFGRPVLKDARAALITVLSFLGFLARINALLVFVLAGALALLLRPAIAREPAGEARPTVDLRPSSRMHNTLLLGVLALLVAGTFVVCRLLNAPLFHMSLVLAKLGALAFGGGFTIIPLIQYEVVSKFHWVSTKEFLDGIAMGQITPGPIMITAAFLGYKLAGFWGAALATVANFSPSFFIIMLVAPYHDKLRGIAAVRVIEQGILAAFVGMLGLVLYHFGQAAFVDVPSVIFAAAAFIALLKKIDLAYILLAGAVLSIIVFGILL